MKFVVFSLAATLFGVVNTRSLNFTELDENFQRDILKRACDYDTPCTCQGITLVSVLMLTLRDVKKRALINSCRRSSGSSERHPEESQ
ncbi:hypothetical protein BKA62DRAFT_485974 [Auriculariales sp. MPI-PUGE-AT-0066]|nr:hypothetical protein BKA62DRAFT_485974 [Auriculariales sp. MPI-PUGE-AT-0066]